VLISPDGAIRRIQIHLRGPISTSVAFAHPSVCLSIINDTNTQDQTDTNSTQRQVSWDSNTTDTSRLIGSLLSRSMTNSKIQNFKKDIDMEIQELKRNLEKRMDLQDQRISKILQMMRAMNSDMETRIAQAVILAMVKESQKYKNSRMADLRSVGSSSCR
jgi:hypothetical protein